MQFIISVFIYFRFELELFGSDGRNVSIRIISKDHINFDITGESMKVGLVAKLNKSQIYELNVTTEQGDIPSYVRFTGSSKDEDYEFFNSTGFPLKKFDVILMEFANKVMPTQVQSDITKTYKLDIKLVKSVNNTQHNTRGIAIMATR